MMFPGVSLDLIEGWINDRYAEIMGELPWSRQNVTGVIQTAAPYATGTVALTNGSNAVTGSGTAFTAAMTGRGFRVTNRDEIYEFTRTSGTAGTLDRSYEGATASGLGYKIFEYVYLLPTDCRMLQDQAFSAFSCGALDRMDRSQLNDFDPGRKAFGTPKLWASYMDDASIPPRMQVELYPIPDAALSIPFDYQADAGELTSTSTALQVWVQPTALFEGVVAKIKAHLRDYVGAQTAAGAAEKALANMRTSEAQGMAPAALTLDSHYTSHRRRRW